MVTLNNKLVVKNEDGKEVTINVIDIIEDTVNNKQYICYNFEGMEDVFVSNLIENETSYTLETVSLDEKKAIENVLNQEVVE